jgi:GNAT superfamily N-acetyltransferase
MKTGSALYALAEGLDEFAATMRRVILSKIEPVRGFVQVTIDDQPAAVGLGVVENGWLGIYCMSSRPAFRRRGAATAILRTLAIWAQMNDAQNALFAGDSAQHSRASTVSGRWLLNALSICNYQTMPHHKGTATQRVTKTPRNPLCCSVASCLCG